jgi:hypothetical protein
LTKYLKYLFSLSGFGLMVNDGILDSQSIAAPYDQFRTIRKDFNNSKSYLFNQITSSENFIANSFGTAAFAIFIVFTLKVLLKC